jgi:putative DNA primase/helicase
MTAQALHAMAAEARSVRIESEIIRRNIKLSAGTVERCGPCPVCGGTDRFSINLKKQLWNCRGCATGGDIIDLVRHIDGFAFKEAVAALAGHALRRRWVPSGQSEPAGYMDRAELKMAASELPSDAKRSMDMAAWLWGRREPISESNAAGRYLRKRGYAGSFPATLGYLPPNGRYPPAMIVAFGFCDEPEPGLIAPPAIVTGIHLTRLTPEGEKIAGNKPKIMLGAMSGSPIVLAPINDGLGLALAEGIEDALSVFEETGLGVWAAGAAGNMPKIAAAIPHYVECVIVFAHRDKTGMRFGKEAARLIAAMGVEVYLKGRG